MTQLTIALPPDLERRLSEAAEKHGQAVEEYARTVLEASVSAAAPNDDPYAGLPRRAAEELDALARAQGVPLVVDVDDLVGDFWPEDELCDEFIAAVREM